jgi:uncharacterized membrane protein
MNTRRSLKLVVVLATLLVALAPAISQAQKGKKPGGGGGGDDGGGDVQPAAYTITAFLPPNYAAIASNVQGINDVGDVVGDLDFADGQKVAMHLDLITGDYTTLSDVLIPFDINNARQIVGDGVGLGVFLESPFDSSLTVLPPLPGDHESSATGINDHGIVIGWSRGNSDEVAVVWSVAVGEDGVVVVDGPVELPSVDPDYPVAPSANDINEIVVGDDGTATAEVVGESAGQPVVWTVAVDAAGLLTEPAVDRVVDGVDPISSAGRGINNFGDTSGRSGNDPFVSFAGAATLILPVPRRTLTSNGLDINDGLEVVGYVETGRQRPGTRDAVLWRNGNLISLSTQIASDSGWDKLSVADSINQLGMISGVGVKNGQELGFVMVPSGP